MHHSPPTPPLVIGHRGAAGSAPENTLGSLATAARLGVRVVEFDVRLTRCGTLVLFHDDTLERTSDGAGRFDDLDLARILRLDAGRWFSPPFVGEAPPTLDQALASLALLDLRAIVEMKTSPEAAEATARRVAETLCRAPDGLIGMVSSKEPLALGALALRLGPVPRAYVLPEPIPEQFDQAAELGCAAVHLGADALTPDLIARARQRVVSVGAFTINDREHAATLAGWGVDTLFSDHPERLPRAWLGGDDLPRHPRARTDAPPAA